MESDFRFLTFFLKKLLTEFYKKEIRTIMIKIKPKIRYTIKLSKEF